MFSGVSGRVVSGRVHFGREKPNDSSTFENIRILALVPGEHAGLVIGRRGSKINALRRSIGGSIHVFEENLPESGERLIAMKGRNDQILKYICAVLDLDLYSRERGPVSLYHPKQNKNALDLSEKNAFNWYDLSRRGYMLLDRNGYFSLQIQG